MSNIPYYEIGQTAIQELIPGRRDNLTGTIRWDHRVYHVEIISLSQRVDMFAAGRQMTMSAIVLSHGLSDDDGAGIEVERDGYVDSFGIRSFVLNIDNGTMMIEVQGHHLLRRHVGEERGLTANELGLRQPGETSVEVNGRGLEALRELIDEVDPILSRRGPDRELTVTEIWRD